MTSTPLGIGCALVILASQAGCGTCYDCGTCQPATEPTLVGSGAGVDADDKVAVDLQHYAVGECQWDAARLWLRYEDLGVVSVVPAEGALDSSMVSVQGGVHTFTDRPMVVEKSGPGPEVLITFTDPLGVTSVACQALDEAAACAVKE